MLTGFLLGLGTRPQADACAKPDSDGFQHYRARIPDCRSCRLWSVCFSPTMKRRAILLHKTIPPCCARGETMRAGARTSAPSTEATGAA